MRLHVGCLLAIGIGLFPFYAVADSSFVVVEDSGSFCRPLLRRLNGGVGVDKALAQIGATAIVFSHGQMTFQASASGPPITEPIDYAFFDIDNDGHDEVLVKYLTSIGGEYGELLWILRAESRTLDFAKAPRFSWQEYARFEAIESMTPWPYESRGLLLVQITPFSLKGVHYVGIKDTHFANSSFVDRTWVIAKFSGRRLGPGGFGHDTDDFKTVCAFKIRAQ